MAVTPTSTHTPQDAPLVLAGQDAPLALAGQGAPLVLVIGFANSVHTARWLGMLRGRGLRLVLLPVLAGPVIAEFGDIRTIATAAEADRLSDRDLAVFDITRVSDDELAAAGAGLAPYQPYRPEWLAQASFTEPAHLIACIRRLRPALVHALVVQFGGYLTLAARHHLGADFPPWLMSNWGSDVFLYRRLADHQARLRDIALTVDSYHCECRRDLALVKRLGYRGDDFPVMPASGGADFTRLPQLDDLPPPSRRREILIKGYHGWAGRGLHILAALELAAGALRGYTIRIILAGPEVTAMAREIADRSGLNLQIDHYLPDHRDALARLARARMVVGLSISDGISTTLLEAMAVGTFVIQSTCACGDEWVNPGETGLAVIPHDIRALADAIRRVAHDDELVDRAAPINRRTVEQRWNVTINGAIAAAACHRLIARHPDAAADQPETRHAGKPA